MALRRPQSYREPGSNKLKGNRTSKNADNRTIPLGKTNAEQFPDNRIITSKYTIWTFLPKNLYEQFRRIANFYFLCMAVIALIMEDSPVSPLTSILPLLFVVVVTGVKQAYEDFLRHRADREVNNYGITVIRDRVPQTIAAEKIQVGDIVRVNDEQDVPCDIVLLVSSHKESKCFVTTANLDGETNLKTLYCPRTLKRNLNEEELGKLDATIECERPTADLYKYYGRLLYGKRTSHFLKKSIIKRQQSSRHPIVPRGPHCCYAECTNCGVRLQLSYDSITDSEESIRCDCQCRTRGIAVLDADEAAASLREFENTVKAFEEKVESKGKQDQNGRSNSLSTTTRVPTGEPLSKINSSPDVGIGHGRSQYYANEQLSKEINQRIKKTHKKTESNVSRVSFNLENIRRGSETSSHRAEWTLERKTSLLSRRNSVLLKSRRMSSASFERDNTDPLGAENLLLRGSRLKNTDFIYGCAVYTGQDSKLALNSKSTSNKFSTVEKSVNKFLIFYLLLLLVEVIASTILKILGQSNIGFNAAAEKRFKAHVLKSKKDQSTTFGSAFEDFFNFVVLYNYVIPISLYVTMEMQKFIGTLFFEWDLNMYKESTDEPAICNTSDLNEDLGQIEYLFTDKTGTLTENSMQFRRCSVGTTTYLKVNDGLYPVAVEDSSVPQGTLPVDLTTCDETMEGFLLTLALCHTVQVEERPSDPGDDGLEGKFTFSASSPDEKALVEAMQDLDIVFTNDADDLIVLRIFGQEKIFERKEVFEFTSDRKRMSVIVRDEDGKITLYCKGAETALLPLLSEGPKDVALQHVAQFASKGLRTLMVGQKILTEDQYQKITEEVNRARSVLSADRDFVVAKAYESAEGGLTLLGATGVEDELQEGIEQTLDSLREAGIKVWILTGDKIETAVNISMSCGHFKSNTAQLQLVGRSDSDNCEQALHNCRDKIEASSGTNFGLIVDGESLATALGNHKELLQDVCMKCTAVICCRMSPLQKSEVVNLVKVSTNKPITAAVGDGANDVSMIQEAHVGLGIMGKEGRQAVRCADFAFGKFKFLREAFLVHGHWYYLRVATLVQYFFYKNIVFILPQFYFLFFNGYSTEPLYDSMYLTFFNIVFTSLPILVYGLLEQNFPAERLRYQPKLYNIHSRNSLMTWRHFFKWFFLGVYHSLIIFFFPLALYSQGSNIMQNGRDSYLELFGTQIYHSSVVVVNLKLWLHSRYWCVPFSAALALSVAAWFIFAALYSIVELVDTADVYYVFLHMMASPSMWLISIVVAAACLIPDIIVDVIVNCGIVSLSPTTFTYKSIAALKKKHYYF